MKQRVSMSFNAAEVKLLAHIVWALGNGEQVFVDIEGAEVRARLFQKLARLKERAG
jgi:hypothetical protein